MNLDTPVFVDFETEAIGPRPLEYPPKPCGVSILDPYEGDPRFGGELGMYYTGEEMHSRLKELWSSGRVICFHNAIFDLEVTLDHLGLPWPTYFHDTLILAFLTDCNAESLSLKFLAEKWCGIEPQARDELVEWILRNIPKSTPKNAGAFISKAPVPLVATYAVDDVRMTHALFEHCWPAVRDEQLKPYWREIKLLKILVDNSKAGIRVDREAMIEHLEIMRDGIRRADEWICQRLNSPGINVGSGPQLAQAILQSGLYHQDKPWPTTPKGAPRTNRVTVEQMISDKTLIDTLRYRGYMDTLCGTYLEPWIELSQYDGRIHTNWNPVRGEHGGTRTGRLSCKPTVQTAPSARGTGELHLEIELPPIPSVRKWLLPDEGEVMVAADFNGQELRLFAHFENGLLAEKYRENPRADLHTFASDTIKAMGFPNITRVWAKDVSFCVIYGGGAGKIAEIISNKEFREVSVNEVRPIVRAYETHVATRLPYMRQVMKQRYARNQPITTLGGRKVLMERPKVVNGRRMEFDYKGINLLVQGSAADQCKEAMVTYDGPGRIWLSAHDELVITCKPEDAEAAGIALQKCMCEQEFPISVPMIADVQIGHNYSEVK
jgi:DNA polymerase I-like protein with 3'-5' exonuclease and polymerase domains